LPGHAALITAGGKGSRLSSLTGEKPLLKVLGSPMVDWVAAAVRSAGVEEAAISVSDATPLTARRAACLDLEVISTPGEGYGRDLNYAAQRLHAEAVLILPCDMPLLKPELLRQLLEAYDRCSADSMTVLLPEEVLLRAGVVEPYLEEMEGRRVGFCGVSVLKRQAILETDPAVYVSAEYFLCDDISFAVNVNTPADLALAERLLLEAQGA
jgi:adenosylcobinamide-phosphate guanylyltransferase